MECGKAGGCGRIHDPGEEDGGYRGNSYTARAQLIARGKWKTHSVRGRRMPLYQGLIDAVSENIKVKRRVMSTKGLTRHVHVATRLLLESHPAVGYHMTRDEVESACAPIIVRLSAEYFSSSLRA